MMIQINCSPLVCIYDNEREARQAAKDIKAEIKEDQRDEKVVLKNQKVRSVGVTSSVWVLTVAPK